MRILSLFDWMACWYEALLRAWIKIDKYYASEIDKYAIQIALKNHPDIIEIWDVCNVKWEDYQDIDLLIWGSPCQWFSVAGKMLNFDDPRSKLFFEYVRLLKEIKPKYFLLENVKMKKEWQDIISSALWVQPIEINSSLVSAQNRKRLYRTNIPNVSQPKDKGIILKDILQENVDEKYYYSAERWNRILAWKYDIAKRLEDAQKKCNTIMTVWWGNHEKKILVSHIRKLTPIEYERLQTLPDNYTAGVSDSQRYKMLWNWWTVNVVSHIFSFMECKSPIKDAAKMPTTERL